MIDPLRPPNWIGLALCLASVAPQVWAQNQPLREQVFARADQALADANEAEANVLAPVSYAEASRFYRDAETALERGRRLEGIREDIAEAITHFDAAVAAAELARVSLRDAIAARDDAIAADAGSFADRAWREAEQTFATAARRLEDGTLAGALRAGEEAEEQYRVAEMTAIENNYLSGARMRIAEAEDLRVDRYAPITLQRARNLLADAEEGLRRDRYDTDYPRTLAREANYEARHAIYLAERIRAMQDRDISAEELLLQAEAPLGMIAGELDIVAEFDAGFEPPSAAILSTVQDLRADSETLQQRNEQLAFLEDELANLEARLGDESEQLRLQQQIQERFEQVDAVFTREEAQVLRRGNDVIVRMGLNFDVGSASIKSEYFPLLRKIQAAIDVFPGSRVEVQGHTDAFGADDANMALSLRRAQAVQQYLRANMQLRAVTLDAVGYGETVPLANNETPEGRLRNRRIDLLIQTNLDALIAEISGN
jgi:outer membrane protein OmpA-like peptidoglycan-associated protein